MRSVHPLLQIRVVIRLSQPTVCVDFISSSLQSTFRVQKRRKQQPTCRLDPYVKQDPVAGTAPIIDVSNEEKPPGKETKYNPNRLCGFVAILAKSSIQNPPKFMLSNVNKQKKEKEKEKEKKRLREYSTETPSGCSIVLRKELLLKSFRRNTFQKKKGKNKPFPHPSLFPQNPSDNEQLSNTQTRFP